LHTPPPQHCACRHGTSTSITPHTLLCLLRAGFCPNEGIPAVGRELTPRVAQDASAGPGECLGSAGHATTIIIITIIIIIILCPKAKLSSRLATEMGARGAGRAMRGNSAGRVSGLMNPAQGVPCAATELGGSLAR